MELNSSSEKASDLASKFEKLPKEMIVNNSKPQSSKKYPQRHLKEWGQLDKLYHKWKAFHAFLRSSAEDVLMELNGKVEKEPSVLSEGGGGAKRAIYIRRFLCFSYLIIILGRVAPGGGAIPYKNDGSARRTF